MHVMLLLALLAHVAVARPATHKHSVDLLKMDLTRIRGVTKAPNADWLSFGKHTGDIALDSDILKHFMKKSERHNEMTFASMVRIKEFDVTGKSTLVSFTSIISSRKHFEVYIKKTKEFKQQLEGVEVNGSPERDIYNLGVTYISKGRTIDHVVSLDRFRLGEWFTLMVRLTGKSELVVSYNCKQMESTRLNEPMDRIPMYVEGRLAQAVDRDFWTFEKITTNRFIGDIKEAQFLFGKAAFNSDNPCKDYSHPGMAVEGIETQGAKEIEKRPLEDIFGSGSQKCVDGMNVIDHGKQWFEGPCKTCRCQDGKISCWKQENCTVEKVDP